MQKARAPQQNVRVRFRIDGLGRALQKSISKNQQFRKKDIHVNRLWMILRIIGTRPINLWDDLADRANL